MILQDKYAMDIEENIWIAKRLLVDSVYTSANLEGIAVTFAQTQDILNNVNVSHLTPKDINKVCCLRDAWEYMIEHIHDELNMRYLMNIHELIARFDVPYSYLGRVRTDDVIISGTNWRPEVHSVEYYHKGLMELQDNPNVTDRAIRTGLWLMRCQVFKDGNKRIGSFAINKILIENGRGIFKVPVELDGTFKQMLVSYYESNNADELASWICDNCLDGVNKIQVKDDIEAEADLDESIENPEYTPRL